MRRVLAVAAVIAAGCAGTPTTPSPTPQSSGALASGPYQLTVSMATSGNSGVSACVSASTGTQVPGFSAIFVPMPVHVAVSGSAAAITPDDESATFRMQIQIAGANVSGTASGQFRSRGTTVTVTGPFSNPSAAAATGVIAPTSARGSLDGTVSVEGLSCTNNGHSWSLTPR